ncbi:AlpA family phage regulatory protein [Bradyrhizobium pachyrhizi]|uniref:helix-turn-helix transcriptional regulator n=1 Tax=Bradyrhizobium pachyrhizi TaxID=280333 RepID=UPI0024B181B9|nr:AlpA family phage regulatory protein [Bradyrhizobium pachyrhizi]WFU52179.1 AlpA family phage regulatory protein [Bradyrhizobium pachyrhizi]
MTTETAPVMGNADEIRPMISIKEVLKRLPLSRSTLHRMVKEKRFPKAHELSPMRIGFFLDEVVEWQKKLSEKAA